VDLSIVITTRNRYQDLIRCLESVKKARKGKFTFEVVIIDDASSDETRNLKENSIPELPIKIFKNHSNQMMSATRNSGIKHSSGSAVLFIDDDNIIDKLMLKYLMDALVKYKNYGIIGPSMYLYKGKQKYMDFQKVNLVTGKTTVGFHKKGKSEMCDSDGIPNVFLVRREIFNTCGIFDESIIQTYTEPDLAYRAKKAGYKCGVYIKAKTYHNVILDSAYSPRNMGGAFKQKAYCLMRNRMLIVRRYGNWFQKIVFLVFFSWGWPILYSLLMLRFGRFDLMKYYLYGFVDGFKYMITGKLENSLSKLL